MDADDRALFDLWQIDRRTSRAVGSVDGQRLIIRGCRQQASGR
jgi:hypothetical protein